MRSLEHIGLSTNLLSGKLPDSMASMTRVRSFKISRNQLSGMIPDAVVFMTRLCLSAKVQGALKGTNLRGRTNREPKRRFSQISANSKHRQVTDLDVTDLGFSGPRIPFCATGALWGRVTPLSRSLCWASKQCSGADRALSQGPESRAPKTPNHPQRKPPLGAAQKFSPFPRGQTICMGNADVCRNRRKSQEPTGNRRLAFIPLGLSRWRLQVSDACREGKKRCNFLGLPR